MIEAFIFRSALADHLRFRRILVWVLVAATVYGLGLAFRHLNPKEPAQDTYVMLSSTFVFRILPLAAAIFATTVLSQEVEQKTIVYLLTRPVARWKLLTMRTLAAAVVVAAISCLAAFFASLAVYGGGSELLSRDLVALIVGAFTYTSIFVFVSLLMNRAMIACLLFAFGWEPGLSNFSADMGSLSVSAYLNALSRHPAPSGPKNPMDVLGGLLGTNVISTDSAWAVLAVMILASLAGGAWWFTHFEYLPREDAA